MLYVEVCDADSNDGGVLFAQPGSLAAAAQMGGMAKGLAPGTIAAPAEAFDSQLSVIEGEMMSAVKAMPADKFDFAPSPAIFVPGQTTEFATVRTFAQQATHVAEANYFFYGIISGMRPDVDPQAITKLTKRTTWWQRLPVRLHLPTRPLPTLTPANSFQVIKSPEPGFQTRATLASFGISHAFDHYGQMVEYLRMNGIVPPASAR